MLFFIFDFPPTELQAFIAKVSGRKCKGQILSAERCKIGSVSHDQPLSPERDEYECNRLLIKDIPKAVNEDVLVTFLEGILESEHETVFVVKLKNARATVNFTRECSAEGILYTRILMLVDVIL